VDDAVHADVSPAFAQPAMLAQLTASTNADTKRQQHVGAEGSHACIHALGPSLYCGCSNFHLHWFDPRPISNLCASFVLLKGEMPVTRLSQISRRIVACESLAG